MEWFNSILPVATVVTIVLFFLKEIWEGWKRWRSDVRKLRAIRMLLARECEHNLRVYGQLARALQFITEQLQGDIPFDYAIERRPAGDVVFLIRFPDGKTRPIATLSDPYTEVMADVMREVAELSSNLFDVLERAYDSRKPMEHVRNRLIDNVDRANGDRKLSFSQDFARFGSQTLAQAIKDLEGLQQECKRPAMRRGRKFLDKMRVLGMFRKSP